MRELVEGKRGPDAGASLDSWEHNVLGAVAGVDAASVRRDVATRFHEEKIYSIRGEGVRERKDRPCVFGDTVLILVL